MQVKGYKARSHNYSCFHQQTAANRWADNIKPSTFKMDHSLENLHLLSPPKPWRFVLIIRQAYKINRHLKSTQLFCRFLLTIKSRTHKSRRGLLFIPSIVFLVSIIKTSRRARKKSPRLMEMFLNAADKFSTIIIS